MLYVIFQILKWARTPRLRYSGMWCLLVWSRLPVFGRDLLLRIQQVPPKRRHLFTKVLGVTSIKTVILITLWEPQVSHKHCEVYIFLLVGCIEHDLEQFWWNHCKKRYCIFTKFDVLTVVYVKILVFWDITLTDTVLPQHIEGIMMFQNIKNYLPSGTA